MSGEVRRGHGLRDRGKPGDVREEHRYLGVSTADLRRLTAVEQFPNDFHGHITRKRVQRTAHVFLSIRQVSDFRQSRFHVDLHIGLERLKTRTVFDQRLQRLAIGAGEVERHECRDSQRQQGHQEKGKPIAMVHADKTLRRDQHSDPETLLRSQIILLESAPPRLIVERELKRLRSLPLAPPADAFRDQRYGKFLGALQEKVTRFPAGLEGRNQDSTIIRQNKHLPLPGHRYSLRKI